MRTCSTVLVQISFIYLCCITIQVLSRPLKVFARGFNGKNLPPGGWTHWFNVDHPGGAGDFETYENIVRRYGRTCIGIPCKRPVAVRVMTVYGLRPSEAGNHVKISARRGLKCYSSYQHNNRCHNYKVRFYCKNLHTKCSRSRYYPHHWDQSTDLNITNNSDPGNSVDYEEKMQKLEDLTNKKENSLNDVLYTQKDALKKLKKKKFKTRKLFKKSHRKRRIETTKYAQVEVQKHLPPLLPYHPRHPRST